MAGGAPLRAHPAPGRVRDVLLGLTIRARPRRLLAARLTLEPLRAGHAAEMADGLRDPALYRYLPDQPPAGVSEVARRYRRIARGRSPDGADLWCNWIVRRNTDRLCVGTVQATIEAFAGGSGRVLIGYMILPRYWRRGYAREAVSAMLDCLFTTFGCEVAEALVDTRNAGSLALLASLGFRIVGRIEDADHFHGATSHEYELALDRARWLVQPALSRIPRLAR